MADLLAVDAALAAVLARAVALSPEPVPLAASVGRILAEDLVSSVDLPPFPSSSMDGYAIRASDTPGTLRVVGKAAAGHPVDRELGVGEAIDISTGAVVPVGADAVVPIEHVAVAGDGITVGHAVAELANIRERGGDVEVGDTVARGGETVTAARLAALAACGVATVSCARAPAVAVVVTGSELRPPGEPLAAGQIYESNGVMLEALLAGSGARVERLGVAEDTDEAIGAALERALAADVVVSSGGVSVGPHDLVRRIEAELGVEEVFWGVAMRPGKPLSFATRGNTLVFGLPGNPVSTLVGCLLFVRPAILALQGHPHPAPPFRPGRVASELRRRPERDDFVRACVRWSDDGPILEPILGQESHMIVRSSLAEAIIRVPRGVEPLPPGSVLEYLPL